MSVFGEIFYKCHKHSLYIYGFDDVERVRYVFRLYVTMVSIFNDELSKYFSGSFRTIVEFFLNFTYLQLKLMIFHFWKYFLSKYSFFHLSFLVDNYMYLIRSWTHTRIRKNQKINLSEVPLSGTFYSLYINNARKRKRDFILCPPNKKYSLNYTIEKFIRNFRHFS